MIFRTITDEITGANKSIGLFSPQTIDINAIERYNTLLKNNFDAQKELEIASKNTNQATISLMQSANGAAVSTEQLTIAQKASTIAAKAQSGAFKALSIAGNMLLFMAVTKGIQLAVKAIDDYIHRAENAKKRTDELFEKFKDLNNTLSDHKKTVAELADRYDELANGVNLSNNKNKTLSTDEYEEFLKINKQLADSFPSLSKGIDENGNSILSLGTKGITAKEQLEELLKTEENLNNFRIAESIDEAFAGVLTYVKEAEQASENLKNSLSETNKEIGALQEYLDNGIHLNQDHYLLFSGEITDKVKTDYMYAMESAAREFYDSLDQDRIFELRSHDINGFTDLFHIDQNDLTDSFYFYANLLHLDPEKEIPELERLIGEYVKTLSGALSDQFDSQRQGFQEQIYRAKNEWTDFLPYYISAMKSKSTFKNLDSDMQDIAVKIVEGLDYSLTNEFEKYDPTNSYSYIRDKLIVPLGDLSADNKQLVKDKFNELFTLDSDDISQNNQEQIDQIIKDIAAILEKDHIEIRAILGFDVDISEAQKNYQESLDRAKRKFSGYEYDDRGFQTNISNELGKVVDEFYEANVKTQDDIALWERVTTNIYDAVEAMDAYVEAKNQSSDSDETPDFFTQLNNSKDSLDKFQSSVKSAYDAYSTLLSGNYSSNELLDSIQAINQAMSDIGSEIQWESMFGGGIGLAQVQEVLEREFQKYAESILRDVGIEISSDFGQMLAHNIVNAQKASTQLEVLNDQIDSLQSAYSDLTDIVKTYNKTGYITFDQLQKLLAMEPQYLSCLIDENGQLQLNEQAMVALAEQRLIDAKAQAVNQAIVELGELAYKNEKVALDASADSFEREIDVIADYNEALATAIAETSVMIDEINNLNAAIMGAEENGASEDQVNTIVDNLYAKWKFADLVYDQMKNGGIGSVMKSGSSTKDFEETFDWIETAIDRIGRSISNLDLKASSVYRSWSERNSNLKAELLDVKKEMDIQASGYNRYMQQANSVGLSEEWANKVRNGQIDINSITDKTLAEQIKQYQEYYEKALDCQDAVESLRESVSKLYETAFDNIVSQFDNIVSVIENSKSMLDEQINQAEERGYIANVAYYEALIKVEQKNIEQLTKERTSLQSALADAVSNGAIAEGSAEWADMQQKINDVTLAIEQANTAMIKYGNSIRDIQWQIFDLIQDRISRISSESDFLINLLSYDKQYDDRGQLTDTGMSTVGLHGMNYNVYMAQADKYAQEMLRINEELAKDPNNLELYNRKAELIELQQESIIAAENEKQAIVDMVEEGIKLELDAIQSLISSYEDALSAQKD